MPAASVNLRNLVYKLCEGRHVPLLVTDMIAGYLVHRDVFKISVLSRSLNAQANTTLYTDIVIDLNGSAQSTKKASLLLRTLRTSESAVQAVRTLSLTGNPLQDWREELTRHRPDSIEGTLRGRLIPGIYVDLNDFTQKEIVLFDKIAASNSASMRSYISEVSVWALFLHVLRVAPQVQELKVSSDYFRFDDFRSTLQDVARGLSTARLRSCSMCLDLKEGLYRHASVVKGWDNVLLALFAVPGIQSMATAVSLESGTLRHLRPGGSSITRLVLHHYQIEHFDLSPLLAATSGLKYLEYRLQTDHASIGARCCREANSGHRVGLEPLFGALHHVGDSLQELHTFQEIDEDSIHFSPGFGYSSELVPQQRGELSSLKQLHALTIPYGMLLGWSRKDCVWDWNSILPSSLRRIILTDDLQNCHHVDDWTDDDLMPIISSLVEWLTSPLRGDRAAAFGLDLEFLDADFTEPVRQELIRMCKERGVRCDIKKAEADRPKWALPRPRMAMPRGRGHAFRGRGRGV